MELSVGDVIVMEYDNDEDINLVRVVETTNSNKYLVSDIVDVMDVFEITIVSSSLLDLESEKEIPWHKYELDRLCVLNTLPELRRHVENEVIECIFEECNKNRSRYNALTFKQKNEYDICILSIRDIMIRNIMEIFKPRYEARDIVVFDKVDMRDFIKENIWSCSIFHM